MTMRGDPFRASTGWPGLDSVLGGLEPGDNVVLGFESIGDYRRMVHAYEEAAFRSNCPRVYFRFADHPPLLDSRPGLRTIEINAQASFEGFVRRVHDVIGEVGPEAAYVFDNLSHLAEAWMSDQAMADFFILTCPRLRDLRTLAYFGLRRDVHAHSALEVIRGTTQFFLDLFNREGRFYIRPLKVQYRSPRVMNTVHVQDRERLIPVDESVVLAPLLSRTRWPSLRGGPPSERVDALFDEIKRALGLKREGRLSPAAESELLCEAWRAFRVHRSGISGLVARYLTLEDFADMRERQIGEGSIGGKAFGMLVARAILRRDAPHLADRLEVHDSFFVGASAFVSFLVRNGVWWIRDQQRTADGFLKDLTEGRGRILAGEFQPDIVDELARMLDYFGEMPCIVRSSSILEDDRGNAFSGKYDSIFLTNQGSRKERLEALLEAIRKVYASVFQTDTLLYRRERGLLESEERMALLIMRVSGGTRGRFFFPQAAGVGLSYNPYRWHEDIDPDAGMVRLVFGMGTRAVDRADGDYTRLIALNMPNRRPETSLNEELDHAQRHVDLLDLEARQLIELPINQVAPLCTDFPVAHFLDNAGSAHPWIAFRGLIRDTPVLDHLRAMLRVLEAAYAQPVDIEFTINFLPDGNYHIHLLQCRTFQMPKGVPGSVQDPVTAPGTRLLTTRGAVIGLGRSCPIHDIVYVPTDPYAALREQDRVGVARLIELLVQSHDPRRHLLLVGPGRWGTSSPSLGVPVRAGRIAKATAVCEVAAMHTGLIPEISLGTHFFNDLVEHELLYLACFPEQTGNLLNTVWLLNQPSNTAAMAGDKGRSFHDHVRWLDVASLKVTLHADPFTQTAALCLEP
jgi:pyruvate, water dikinase